MDRFISKYDVWLKGENVLFKMEKDITSDEFDLQEASTSSGLRGRPQKTFEESSEKTKKRKVQHIVESQTPQQIALAAELSFRKSGKRDAANIIKEIATTSPKRATKIKHIREFHQQQRSLTPEEALALYVDAKWTSHAYKLTRKKAIGIGHYMYPSFYSLRKAKEECCPSEEFISIDETSAAVTLQAILDHTVVRLLQAIDFSIPQIQQGKSLTLISKWGCDGSSGHSQYKQRFSKQNATDEFLFLICFVPLKLYVNDDKETIIWQNPRSSSTRYCRPITFLFEKESESLAKRECEKIEKQIDNLHPTIFQNASIEHKLLQTMIDGKMVNILTDTKGSQICYICGAKPSEMNSLAQKENVLRQNYGYGLSTLHAWIKTFECLLHIAYRLTVKVWAVRAAHKEEFERRKKDIQTKFKSELGLNVDKPKPGYGTTNDGNTARTFFKKATDSARITGINEDLIRRFYIILSVLSSGHEIKLEEFNRYAEETKQLYLRLYPWYYMPVTVHKILTHSTEVIKTCIVPLGQLSEEAQEARNKDCRRFRQFHTRKCSRGATNQDLLTMLLITSDPLINKFRELPRKGPATLSGDVINLLKIAVDTTPPEVSTPSEVSPLPEIASERLQTELDDYLLTDSTEVDSENSSSEED